MIFFIDSWLRPIIPPVMAFRDEIIGIMVNISGVAGRIIYIIINSGAIFCHVDKMKQFFHLIISMVVGNQ